MRHGDTIKVYDHRGNEVSYATLLIHNGIAHAVLAPPKKGWDDTIKRINKRMERRGK